MIRRVLNNQIELAEIQKHGKVTKNPRAELEQSMSHAAAEKTKFKARLLLLFGTLFTLDIVDIAGNVSANVLLNDDEASTTSIILLSNMITVPFYISIHIVVLFALLDMFKGEVLRMRETTNHSSVIDSTHTTGAVAVVVSILDARTPD
jgi:hypothetical protein